MSASTNPIPSQGFFTRAYNYAEKTLGSPCLYALQASVITGLGSMLPLADNTVREIWQTYESSENPVISGLCCLIVSGIMIVSAHQINAYYNQNMARPMIVRRVEKIIAESASENKSKNILILNGSDDSEGALVEPFIIPKLQDLAKTHVIKAATLSTEDGLKKALSSLSKKVDIVWIRAHASPEFIHFSHQLSLTYRTPSLIKQIGQQARDGGSIILASCRTGEGARNIASVISEHCPHVTVYASSEVVAENKFNFGEDGRATFYDVSFFNNKNVTRIYKAGKLQP